MTAPLLPYAPASLLLQWHITERCNLRCQHCYQDNYHKDELSLPVLETILNQYIDLLAAFTQRRGETVKGHITVTGGEPFVRQDFLKLLQLFAAHRHLFSFAILTNGSFIDEQMAKHLQQLKPRFVQVSLEGEEATHDHIRGKGHFQQTVTAIQRLRQVGIHTLVSFTAHRQNYQTFPAVVETARRYRANGVWADRLIPWGSGAKEQVLSPGETELFFQQMDQLRQQKWQQWWTGTTILMHRALQFLVAGGRPYRCNAGDQLLTVQPNGDLYPCRRMPIKVGNVLELSLLTLYDNQPLLQKLRQPQQISQGCTQCFYKHVCQGGLKCLSYALKADPFQADPGCWFQKTENT